MNKKIIGIAATLFDNTEYREKLNYAAQKHGFEIVSLNGDNIKNINKCEIIFGMIPPELLREAVNLKWLACSFAGVDRYINNEFFDSDYIIITNSSGAYGVSISESMIAGILILFRHLDEYLLNQQKQIWGRPQSVRSIYGSKITVIGMGDIGSCFAERAFYFGAEVTGVRRRDMPKPDYFTRQFTIDQLDKALPDADVVALCVPRTDETLHIINEKTLALMNPRTVVVNVGRGSAIDSDALVFALNEGRIGGAFLDVTDPEPLPPSHLLWTAKNCIITPHVSGNMTLELTCERIIAIFLENLELYAEGKPLLHIVNKRLGY